MRLEKKTALIFILLALGLLKEAESWTVVDLIGTNPVNFGPGTTPAIQYYSVDFQSILGVDGTLTAGYSIGCWAQKLNPIGTSQYAFVSLYDTANEGIFAFRFSTATNYPFQLGSLSGGALITIPSSVDFNTYWSYNSWTFFFFSFGSTPDPRIHDTFGYLQTPASDFSLSDSNFLPGEPLKQPDSTSRIYLGGSNTGGAGCRCNLAEVRFYVDLFINDVSLMPKFSDYELEIIYFFNFGALSPNTQTYTVSQTSMTFAINSTDLLTTDLAGIIGLRNADETSIDPLFGPYYINCRGNQISTFQIENGLSGRNAIIIVFRMQSSAYPIQTILSFKSSSETIYRIQYSTANRCLIFTNNVGSVRTTTNTIIPGTWTKVVIVSYVPRNSPPTAENFKVYLNSNTTAISLVDPVGALPQIPIVSSQIAVSLCGEDDFMGGVTNGSDVDICYLEILSPVDGPYEEEDTTTCARWFHYGSAIDYCAFCLPGYFFFQGDCLESCPSGYFEHYDTYTCQSCGSPQNIFSIAGYLTELPPYPYLMINLSTTSNSFFDPCKSSVEISATILTVPEQECGPYTLVWGFTSNSSNPETAVELQLDASQGLEELVIPVETLGFGVAYNFTAVLRNINGVSVSMKWVSLTTVGGSYCEEGYTFPNFAISTNLANGTHASVCENFGISASIHPIVGPVYYSYTFLWSVTTQPTNETEEGRLSDLMNAAIDTASVYFPSNTLLPGYTYNFAATIKSDYAISEVTHSINIQVTECPSPPDFNLTGSNISDVCSPIIIHAAKESDGPFTFSWSVFTNTSNTTENTRVANYLNGLSDTSKVSIPPGYLLFKVNYTFTAIILNNAGTTGANHSVSYLGLMCPLSGGCLAPLYYSNGSCVSQCPVSAAIIKSNDPDLGMIQSCVTGVDVSMSASITKVFDQITIDFDQPILSLLDDPASQIFITLAGYNNITRKDNYSIIVKSDETMQVMFNFSERISAGTEAQVFFSIHYLSVLYKTLDMNSYSLKNANCSVGLLEYYPFSKSETAFISAANSITTVGTAVITMIMTANQVISAGDCSFFLGYAFATAMIQLNRFVNVYYPPNLLILYNNSLQSVIALALPINLVDEGTTAKSNSHRRNLLDAENHTNNGSSLRKINDGSKFALYGMSQYFILSGISPLATIGSLVVIFFLAKFLSRKKKFSIKLRRIFRKVELFLGWNFILTVIISNNLKISMNIALNFAYSDFGNGLGVTSFICSIGIAIINFLLVRHLIRAVLRNHASNKSKNKQMRSLPSRTERIFVRRHKILIENYKNDTIWQPLYVPLLLIRSISIGVILVLFKSYGFAAALFLFLMSLAFVVYMTKHRPIKDKSNLVFQIIFDIIIVVVSLLVLTLSIMDMRKASNPDIRLNIGWAITIANYLIHGLGLVKALGMVVKLIYNKIAHKLKEHRIKRLDTSRNIILSVRDNNSSISPMRKMRKKNVTQEIIFSKRCKQRQ